MLRSRKGFTLLEVLIVLLIFVVVIMISADSFKTILTQMTKISKSEESNIEGVLGLEMFRHDIQQAGFGLPYSYQETVPSYLEAGYAPANVYNDSTTTSKIPRAVVAGNDLGATASDDGTITYNILPGTDYLTVKASSLGLSGTAQKWTYMTYSSSTNGKLKPHIWPAANLEHSQDLVIVLRRAFNGTEYVNQLVYNTGTPSLYWARYYADGFADTVFNPSQIQDMHYLYGIKADPTNGLGMPFNRADYFVAQPAAADRMPTFCSPQTGILYKGVVNHSTTNPGGRLTFVPLLDCVADLQVIFAWDIVDNMGNEGQDGQIDTYSTPSAGTVSPSANAAFVTNALADPEKIRKGLKVVKAYVLAQNGRRDPNFQSAASFTVGDPAVDAMSKTYNLTSAMRNYRWKLYRIVVRPKNLQSIQ